MIRQDLEQIFSAACQIADGTSAWGKNVHQVARPMLEDGHGSLMALLDLSNERCRLKEVDVNGPSYMGYIIRFATFAFGKKIRAGLIDTPGFSSSSEFYSEGEFSAVTRISRKLRPPDSIGFGLTDSLNLGFLVNIPTRTLVAPSAESIRTWNRLIPHLAAGLRLQRVVTEASLDAPAVEAIFDSGGRCVELTGMARKDGVRQGLGDHTQCWDERLRAPLSTGDEAWEAIVNGRWSLVQRVDTDGKRFVVAYRNPQGFVDPRRLTDREQVVVRQAALGLTNKEIAGDLQVAESTVATQLSSALKKLGLQRRTQLPLFWADLHGRIHAYTEKDDGLVTLNSGGPPQAEAASSRLTPSEEHVVTLLTQGLTNSQIAERRGVSKSTVANQVGVVFQKLDVSSRSELAATRARIAPRASV